MVGSTAGVGAGALNIDVGSTAGVGAGALNIVAGFTAGVGAGAAGALCILLGAGGGGGGGGGNGALVIDAGLTAGCCGAWGLNIDVGSTAGCAAALYIVDASGIIALGDGVGDHLPATLASEVAYVAVGCTWSPDSPVAYAAAVGCTSTLDQPSAFFLLLVLVGSRLGVWVLICHYSIPVLRLRVRPMGLYCRLIRRIEKVSSSMKLLSLSIVRGS